jgi:hypothetical protein
VSERYHKPIWLTEYALMRFGPTQTPTASEQAAFVTSSTAMLEGLPSVERYAWFSFPTPKEGGLGTGLYSPGGTATAWVRPTVAPDRPEPTLEAAALGGVRSERCRGPESARRRRH